jgi:hypothetical protein
MCKRSGSRAVPSHTHALNMIRLGSRLCIVLWALRVSTILSLLQPLSSASSAADVPASLTNGPASTLHPKQLPHVQSSSLLQPGCRLSMPPSPSTPTPLPSPARSRPVAVRRSPCQHGCFADASPHTPLLCGGALQPRHQRSPCCRRGGAPSRFCDRASKPRLARCHRLEAHHRHADHPSPLCAADVV